MCAGTLLHYEQTVRLGCARSLPRGLLGRFLLALGAFIVLAKTVEARTGFMPKPVVRRCRFTR